MHPYPEDPMILSPEVFRPTQGSDQTLQDPAEVLPEEVHPYRTHVLMRSLH